MMWRRKREELPEHLELEQWKRRVERRQNRFGVGSFLVAIGALAIAFVALGRDVVVIGADEQGLPRKFETSEIAKWRTDPLRVQHFAKEFCRLWESTNSANLDEDLEAAMGMMSPALAQRRKRDEATYARKIYKNQGVRTVFSDMEAQVATFDPDNREAPIAVTVVGKKTLKSEFGKPPLPTEREQWFITALKLTRVKIDKDAIYGVKVSDFFSRVADTREDLAAMLEEMGT